MTHRYLLALFLLVNTARAQAPIVTARTPVRNALVAPRTADVALTFSQPIDATTASAIAVYPAQSGRKAGVYTTAGNTVNFNPTTDFKAGEKVVVSVPATVRGTNAVAAARQVHEFTTAVAGTGVGNFRLGANTYTGTAAREVATGDVDGDGDVDFVNGNQYGGSGVYVNRNGGNAAGTNTGVFTTTQTVAIVDQPFDLALGDADGDGDLDLFVATSELQVWLNGGNASGSNTGQFSAPAFVNVGLGARSVALGDVDGDGDLDAVVASGNGTAFIVRLNGGNATGSNTGVFSNGGTYTVGYSIVAVALGDVDGDGDLDVLSTISGSSGPAVSVSINGGNAAGSNTGVFTLSQSVRLGGAPEDVVLGDVDGDLDLDFVTTSGGSVAVSLNGGDATGSNTGVFGAVRYVAGISGAFCVTLGDLDADGDLDLLASQPSYIGAGNTVYARLNGGDATGSNTGVFSGGYSAVAGLMTYKIALADLDGDLDLDLLAVNYDSNTVSVRFNQPPPPVLTSVSPSSGVAGTVVTVTGTNLTGATLVVNGRPATAGGNTGTSFAFVVPTGATATGNLVVTTPGGVATVAFAVQLAITSTSPAANGRNASRTSSPFRATFTEPITTNSAGNLRVFSAQSGGSKSGTATSVGNNVSFAATNGTPRTNFQPGEGINVTIPASMTSAGGIGAPKRVLQFTAATAGTGRGYYAPTSSLALSNAPAAVAVGDVDGDGDLDMVTANSGAASASLLLNNGSGVFTIGTSLTLPERAVAVALGDVDRDGDLDLLAASFGGAAGTGTTISIRLNGGNASGINQGTFSNGSDVTVGNGPTGLALGDVDGDGDLDVAVAVNGTSGNGTAVRVLLNGGDATGSSTGVYSNGSSVAVGTAPYLVALGDVDRDGDLDLVASIITASGSGSIAVSLNNGNGAFTGGSTVAVTSAYGLALADVNADGYLDVLTETSVRLNTGTGTFGGGSDPLQEAGGFVATGDVDADGDLDMVTGNVNNRSSLSVRLNNGSGTFGGGYDLSLGDQKYHIALADVDGDGDVDVLSANPKDAQSVSILLNGPPPAPAITTLSPSSGSIGTSVTINGANLTGATSVTFNGTTATFTNNTATQIMATVPVGATTGTVVVTTPTGQSNALSFTVTCPVVTIAYGGATYCQTQTAQSVPVLTGAVSGTFASSSGLVIDAATGAITPSSSTPGTYTVTYSGGTAACPATATTQLVVSAPPIATFTYAAPAYCAGSGGVTPVLGSAAIAGVFSAMPTGLSLNPVTGTITLSSSIPGAYTVTNTVVASGGCAAVTASTQVVVNPVPTAALTAATPTTFCQGGNVLLTASGGTTYQFMLNGTAVAPASATPTYSATAAGAYSVVVTNSAGCTAQSATTTVVVNPLPAAPTLTAQYNGATTTLTSSAATGNQFYLGGNLIPGATNPTYVVNGTPAQLGAYTVTTTNANGCTSAASTPLVVTASAKPLAGTSFAVFPNPTRDGRLTVELTGYRQAAEITVLNALGQVVFSTTIAPKAAAADKQSVDLTQVATGMYLVRVSTPGGVDVRRVVKQE